MNTVPRTNDERLTPQRQEKLAVDGEPRQFGFLCTEAGETLTEGYVIQLEPSEQKTPDPKWENAITLTQMPDDHGFKVGVHYVIQLSVLRVAP